MELIQELMETGGKLGQLWMEGFFAVGDLFGTGGGRPPAGGRSEAENGEP
jgi:hypothetical protein